MGDEESRIREAVVMKDGDKSCGLSCFSPAVASDSFSKVATNLDVECSYLGTTRRSLRTCAESSSDKKRTESGVLMAVLYEGKRKKA